MLDTTDIGGYLVIDINLAAKMGQNRPIRMADLCALGKHVIFKGKYRDGFLSFGARFIVLSDV